MPLVLLLLLLLLVANASLLTVTPTLVVAWQAGQPYTEYDFPYWQARWAACISGTQTQTLECLWSRTHSLNLPAGAACPLPPPVARSRPCTGKETYWWDQAPLPTLCADGWTAYLLPCRDAGGELAERSLCPVALSPSSNSCSGTGRIAASYEDFPTWVTRWGACKGKQQQQYRVCVWKSIIERPSIIGGFYPTDGSYGFCSSPVFNLTYPKGAVRPCDEAMVQYNWTTKQPWQPSTSDFTDAINYESCPNGLKAIIPDCMTVVANPNWSGLDYFFETDPALCAAQQYPPSVVKVKGSNIRRPSTCDDLAWDLTQFGPCIHGWTQPAPRCMIVNSKYIANFTAEVDAAFCQTPAPSAEVLAPMGHSCIVHPTETTGPYANYQWSLDPDEYIQVPCPDTSKGVASIAACYQQEPYQRVDWTYCQQPAPRLAATVPNTCGPVGRWNQTVAIYDACGATCGPATQYAYAKCQPANDKIGLVGPWIPDRECANVPKPAPLSRPCGLPPCINWRSDMRCGPAFPAPDGSGMSTCNPASAAPCCSAGGWCGSSSAYCSCFICADYRGLTYAIAMAPPALPGDPSPEAIAASRNSTNNPLTESAYRYNTDFGGENSDLTQTNLIMICVLAAATVGCIGAITVGVRKLRAQKQLQDMRRHGATDAKIVAQVANAQAGATAAVGGVGGGNNGKAQPVAVVFDGESATSVVPAPVGAGAALTKRRPPSSANKSIRPWRAQKQRSPGPTHKKQQQVEVNSSVSSSSASAASSVASSAPLDSQSRPASDSVGSLPPPSPSVALQSQRPFEMPPSTPSANATGGAPFAS